MITGKRVRLRPFCAEDLPTMRLWFGDAAIMRGWATPEPLVTERDFEKDLEGRFSRFDEEIYLAIEDDCSRLIGRIDAESIDPLSASAEIMIMIGEQDAHGRGFASDAVLALSRYLFRQRGLHRVELTVLADNTAAQRAYLAAGFREEGRLRDHLFLNGRYHDQIVMALLAQECAN